MPAHTLTAYVRGDVHTRVGGPGVRPSLTV